MCCNEFNVRGGIMDTSVENIIGLVFFLIEIWKIVPVYA